MVTRMTRIHWLAACVLVVGGTLAGRAQIPLPTFDVASVKVSTSDEPGGRMATQPGRVIAQNLTLRALLLNAYQVRDSQVDTGRAPDWIATARFDVEATMSPNATREQISQMMQALLVDRFRLVVRREVETRAVYSLAPERADGRLGSDMKPVKDPCASPPADGCGTVTFSPGRLNGRAVSWAQIVTALSGVPAVDRLVVDGGGPSGAFDVELRWTPAGRAGAAAPDVPDSIFTAVREQLGLKLTPANAAVPVIVVTDAKRPDAN